MLGRGLRAMTRAQMARARAKALAGRNVPPLVLRGLQFPSNGQSPAGTLVAFRFTGANMPDIQPLTIVWRYRPLQQTGYYTTFFHTRQDGLFGPWQSPPDYSYWGCHPYPPAGSSGTVHNWEIATDGGDIITDDNGNSTVVTKDQWYSQAAVAHVVGGTQTRIRFYWDLETSTTRRITWDQTRVLQNSSVQPGLIFGDAPWDSGVERMSGILGAVKIFNAQLSDADMISEASDMTQIVTSAGAAARWWFKPTYESVDDLTDSVTGKSAVWVNSNKATLVDI